MRIYLERENFLHYLKQALQLDSRKQEGKKKKKKGKKVGKKAGKKPVLLTLAASFHLTGLRKEGCQSPDTDFGIS